MSRVPVFAKLIVALALLASTGCGSAGNRTLSDLALSAQSVSASGTGTPIVVSYSLTRPATVSAYLVSGAGEKLYLRQGEKRPVAGDYSISFNGAYAPDPRTEERRVAPAGSYKLVLEAKDERGAEEQSSAQLQVQNSDTAVPAVSNLTLFPATISPDGDGVDDSVRATYRTEKQATVTVYLVSEAGKRYVVERHDRYEAGEHSVTWDGQIGNQLLPSGTYTLGVEAQDAAGNVAMAEKSLKIDSASMPDAHILSVDFEPTKVLFGGTVKVTIRVKNTGKTVLRTQGPDPGYTYDSQEGFSTIEGGKYRDQKGLWRVGVDWAGGPGASGSKYPYRWGLGKDLAPGEEATIAGYIRIDHKYPQIWLHAGLIQEQIRYWDNEVGQTIVEIGY